MTRSSSLATTRTALIVEGGGLRGAFAVGALRVLLQRLGPDYFDAVHAVSSGVFAATYYVANQGNEMEATWRDRVYGNQLVNYSGIVRGKPILQLDYLVELFRGAVRLDVDAVMRARSTLEYVLTDYRNGQPAYFDAKRADLFDLMRASSALPRVYPIPVMIDGKPYYDGGQSDAIPIQRAIDRGAERIVVVRTRADGYQKQPRSRLMGAWLLASAPAARAQWLTLHERYNAAVAMIQDPPPGIQILSIAPTTLRVGRLTRSREPIIDAIEAGKVVAAARLSAASNFFGQADSSLRSASARDS